MSTQRHVRWAVVGTSSFAVDWIARLSQARHRGTGCGVSRSATHARSIADQLGVELSAGDLGSSIRPSWTPSIWWSPTSSTPT